MMSRVLVIEDDPILSEGMARHLRDAGFDPVVTDRGDLGLKRLRFERFEVCVLDLMLPVMDGWRVIEELRNEGLGTPIIVVSARGTEHDRVHAIELGADDFLVKPFSMKELVARVKAAERRGTRIVDSERGEPLRRGNLLIDPDNVQAFVEGVSCELTPTEFRLLYVLALDEGKVLSRDDLLQRVWGRPMSYRDRTVDVFVKKLREKVDSRSEDWNFLHTRYGVGYKFEVLPSSPLSDSS